MKVLVKFWWFKNNSVHNYLLIYIYIYGVTINTKEQVSISHRSDIATENSFSVGEHEAWSSGGFTLKEGRGSDRKVRVRVGLDTGFMALDSILYTHEYYGHALNSKWHI